MGKKLVSVSASVAAGGSTDDYVENSTDDNSDPIDDEENVPSTLSGLDDSDAPLTDSPYDDVNTEGSTVDDSSNNKIELSNVKSGNPLLILVLSLFSLILPIKIKK